MVSRKLVFSWIFLLLIFLLFVCVPSCEKKQTSLDDQLPIEILNKYPAAVIKWARIFSPSVLTIEDRLDELNWFYETCQQFHGDSVYSVGEEIETSFWESQVLTRAFNEITGIKVKHDVINESELISRLMKQLEGDTSYYELFVTDADLIGTHLRMQKVVVLSDYWSTDGKFYTNPYLDLDDFLNLEFGQDYDGNQLQLPDYQFSLVYWFRHDWFSDPEVKRSFKKEYGYELGVPLNWAAYEDIARFFTGRSMKNPNDSEVIAYGHADYGLTGPSLGWRFSDAFLSIAGMGDKGLPNGLPVDEWGIRVENKIPLGASVERGGAINSPAAVYALETWMSFLRTYAPSGCRQADWLGLGPIPAKGNIAQTWYWTSIYAALNSDYNKVGSPVCNRMGKPVWRIAPVPRGRYWQDGMKIGYQDAGSWTIPKSTIGSKRHMSWIWAQFCLSKTVALKKFMTAATPVRKSTLYSECVTESMDDYGGLIEFLRSPMIKYFTDSGPNVPHYTKMSALWWKNISRAIDGINTPQEAMDNLAEEMDSLMMSLDLEVYSPELSEKRQKSYWINQPGSPKPEINERENPETISYEELLKQWRK